MKIGFRTPSISRSVSARTSGRVNRALKKSVNPVYGSKGIGVVHDPKKAVYNSIYHQTTVGLSDVGSESPPPSDPGGTEPPRIDPPDRPPKKPVYKRWWFWVIAVAIALEIGLTYEKKQPEQVAEATPAPTEAPTPTPKPTAEPAATPTANLTKKPAAKQKKKATYVYVAVSGNGECYHYNKYCSRMNGNVKRMKLKKAKKKYRACSICAPGW